MNHLHEHLADNVLGWRSDRYASDNHPAIAEILEYQTDPDQGGPRFLRVPQLRALETYWYLRLVERTPHVRDLYARLFAASSDRLAALGLGSATFATLALDAGGADTLLDRIASDDDFVREHRLEALRETLTLAYPSYILALAMGAGKTMLIGAIIATEFAMAQEYPDADFVQNALVFAPGKTILEALRELADMPYDRILPPRMYKLFAAAVSLTFTRDGDPDIPIVQGSRFNVVVTNTEKIRIQKEKVTKGLLGPLFAGAREDEARQDVANRRLQAIASLPHLAIFSDEAHHTYGQKLQTGIKKVRRTVDYLAERTNLVCVVNTTGTPYFNKQPLRDVVIWYGLSQGIADGILKEVGENVYAYDLDEGREAALVRDIVLDFFDTYGEVRLPDGAPARIALYFPQNDDLDALRPAVEAALAERGLPATIVLRNTSESSAEEVDAFNRLNDPRSPHRVILLVNKGTEGWNCPSLFACALVRQLRSSNNFVLQAATRCLRQIPGNDQSARIYLTSGNRAVLDRQLQETYGESLRDLERTPRQRRSQLLVLRKSSIPPVVLRRKIHRTVRRDRPDRRLELTRPIVPENPTLRRTVLGLADSAAGGRVLRALGDAVAIEHAAPLLDSRTAAAQLAATHRLGLWTIRDELERLYGPEGDIPAAEIPVLSEQIARAAGDYTREEETVEVALALVRIHSVHGRPSGWKSIMRDDGDVVFATEITYFVDREPNLLRLAQLPGRPGDMGFHYDPYNFDSRPERTFFERLLSRLGMVAADVEDVYFTGAITDPRKTDFYVEYRDAEDRWRRYSPDFVIRRRDGLCLIVEIKRAHDRDHPDDGRNGRKAKAVATLQELNADRIRYEMIFVEGDDVRPADVERAVRVLGVAAGEDGTGALPRPELLARFCEKWQVSRLELFGSAARGEATPESDVDLLVTFDVAAKHGLFQIMEMEQELAVLFGRKVDLAERSAIENSENWIRRNSILRDARPIWPA